MRLKFLVAILLFVRCLGVTQTAPPIENGFKSFGSYQGGDLDSINLHTGNLMFHIPVFSYPQRGGKLSVTNLVMGSSKNWQVGIWTDPQHNDHYKWILKESPGVYSLSSSGTGFIDPSGFDLRRTRTLTTDFAGNQTYNVNDYSIATSDGGWHWLSGGTASGHMMTMDGSGIQVIVNHGIKADLSDDTATVIMRDGTHYYFSNISVPMPQTGQGNNLSGRFLPPELVLDAWGTTQTAFDDASATSVADANGNAITSLIDTLGRTGSTTTSTTDYSGCVTSRTITGASILNAQGPDGRSSTLKICATSFTPTAVFSQANVSAPSTPANQYELNSYAQGLGSYIGSIVMPDGNHWSFDYDAYGNVTKITLPTGGSISYGWTEIPDGCADGSFTRVSRAVSSRTILDNNGHSYLWSYTWGTLQSNGSITNYVLDPNGNETAHVFTSVSTVPCDFYETETRSYQGTHTSGTLLKTVDTHFRYDYGYTSTSQFAGNVLPDTITTTLPHSQVSKIVRQYDTGNGGQATYGKVTDEKEYDYGNLTTPVRETVTTYQWQANSSYLDAGFLDLPASVVIKDGSGCSLSETDYTYDEPSYLTTYPGTLPTGTHTSAPGGTIRGNVTTVTKWLALTSSCNPKGGTAITTHTKWYDTGVPYQTIDALGRTTTLSYDSAYAGGYATQTCSPQTGAVTHCVSGTYDLVTGLLESLTNENATTQASGNTPGDAAHTSNYTYDTSWRLTQAQAPPDPANGGARATTTFTPSTANAFPLSVQHSKSVTTTLTDSSTTTFDGLERPYQAQHAVPGNTATVLTTYDGLSHVTSVTNPYFTTSDPTYGVTSSIYDGLGRATQVTKQDGSKSYVLYDDTPAGGHGVCTTATDEAGKLRRTCSDALGRLVEVDEPGGTVSTGTTATTSVTISGGFTSAWTSAGPMHPAATGTAQSSVTMSDGSSHTFYFDTNWHLCHLYWNSTSGWSNQDLTEQTEASPAFTGSSVSAVVLSSVVHVFYQSSNQHIIDTEWTGSAWQNLDLTTMTGATALAGTKMSALVGGPNSPQLYYQGTNQHLFLVYWLSSPVNAWGNGDLNVATGQTALMATNSSISSGNYGSGLYPFFISTNQHIITNYWSGTAWTTADLTAITGAALAASGSSLTTLVTSPGATPMMTFYEGTNGHIYSIYWYTGNNTWQTADFSTPNVAASSSGLANNPAGPQAFYFGSNQHLMDANWNGSAWVNSDLTSLSGTSTTAATGSSLSAHGTSAGNTSHVFFAGTNQHIYDTYYSPTAPIGWHIADLFGVANNFVIDSGTVSLTIPTPGSNFTATVCYGVSPNPICAGKPINVLPADIANALAAVLNGTGSPVTATVSGATLTLTTRTPGYNTMTVASMSSTSDNATLFPTGSFTSTAGTFSGGQNAGSQTLTSPLITLYNYDGLGNLLCVEQHGDATTGTGCGSVPTNDATSPWRIRRFTYDSFSRLVTAHNPESGTITYSYDALGDLLQKTSPAPNQGGTINAGTATQTVSYCYDELSRVTGKGYSAQSCPLGTPVVTYAYDSGANAKGKLTSLTDQAGSASYAYDILGRLSAETRVLTGAGGSAVSKNLSYEYNLNGSLAKLHYPSSAVVTYTPDSAGRTVSAVDSGNDINYVTSAVYGPNSSLSTFISGYSTTFAGITNAFSYNKRLQPLTMSATAPGQTVYSIGYDFHAGNGISGNDNGNVFGIINYKDTSHNRDQVFLYDSLNRLTSAQNAGTDCTQTTLNSKTKYWGNSYNYDAWGNLLQKAVTKCGAENLSVTALVNNQLSGYGYDAAGNMTNDPTDSVTPVYDQENRLTGANGYTYTYDADGNRARKSNGTLAANGTLYWYMTPGIVAESDLAGTTTSEYVFFGGNRVARRDGVNGAGGVFYYFSDHLKSATVITEAAGTIKSESDYNPWGGELQYTNNDFNHYKFTGKERDSETGLDYFGARYYSNGLGRWVSADWSPTPIPVPYADFADPQTLNQYGYVRNLPTSKIDADGHCSAPSVQGGHVGICLESYIQTRRFGFMHMGHGDNRGPVANDPNATFRTQTMIDINIATHKVVETSRVDPSETDTGSRMGVVHDWISDVEKGKDGSTTFTVHVFGENGYEADHVPFAPGGWIEMVFTLKVGADGKVTLIGGKTKDFPSVSIYAYQNGNISDIYQQKESGNVDDLNKPGKPIHDDAVKEDASRQCAIGNRAACH